MTTRAAAAGAGAVVLAVAVSGSAGADGKDGVGGSTGTTAVTRTTASARAAGVAAEVPYTASGLRAASSWAFSLGARDGAGSLWDYPWKRGGGFGDRAKLADGWGGATAIFKTNPANDGHVVTYGRFNGSLYLYRDGRPGQWLGGGWGIYNAFLAAGDLAGSAGPDLLARDTSGVLWLYPSHPNGTFAGRSSLGGGWDAYNRIAGRGDLTGDGRSDIVARDGSGRLWLYPGTGRDRAPLGPRRLVGGGWNMYDTILSAGDSDGDGRTDLLARDARGDLWCYAGTGNASRPFAPRRRIGHGWNAYDVLY